MQEKPAEKHKGVLVENGIKEGETTFVLKSKKLSEAMAKGTEEVLFSTCKGKVKAVFDAMDFERIL